MARSAAVDMHGEILERLGANGRLLLMDRDPSAIAQAEKEFGKDQRVHIRQANFAAMGLWNETGQGLDGVFLDLGVSSPQLDDASRGFSFQADGPLTCAWIRGPAAAPPNGWLQRPRPT